MLIDWFTVGAQAINFLILVWLMKRFLYKPVQGAIDAREKRIASELAAAASAKAGAERERAELQQKQTDIEQQRATLLKKATDDADAERRQLLDAARKAAEALGAQRREALKAEAQTLDQSLRSRTEQEVFAIARRALMDLATASLEERFGDVFTRRLREISGREKSALADALKTDSSAVVRSAFDLPEKERATIQNALNETFSADVRVRFETAPSLVCGIELVTTSLKVGWSIESYLGSMKASVDAALRDAKADAVAVPDPTHSVNGGAGAGALSPQAGPA
jgi:F-type H+-transporting ATPase subunit b